MALPCVILKPPYPDALATDPLRSGLCQILAVFSPAVTATFPMYFDNAQVLRELFLCPKLLCPVLHAIVIHFLGIFRTLPVFILHNKKVTIYILS